MLRLKQVNHGAGLPFRSPVQTCHRVEQDVLGYQLSLGPSPRENMVRELPNTY